jgi:S-adenosylhomocysteine hydrolase
VRVIEEFLNQRPQTALFHYTTPAGLIGILEESSIWASSSYHLNDAAEFRYAIRLIMDRLQLRLQSEHGPNNPAYGNLLESLQMVTKGVQVFIASFSEQGDLLSQWLAYSGSDGYALGIDAQQAEAAIADGFTLVRCVYELEAQTRIADAFIDIYCDSSDGTTDRSGVIKKALIVASAIKHPGFEKEAEWRLVKALAIGWHDEKLFFRPGRNGIVPYMKARLSSADAKYIPSMIYIGPNGDMDAAAAALETFLSYRGDRKMFRPQVEVVQSRTPYRP